MSSDSFYPPTGGGSLSFRRLAFRLEDSGCDVSACYAGDKRDDCLKSYPLDVRLRVRGLWPQSMAMRYTWTDHFRAVLEHVNADIVLTQQTVMPPTIEVCKDSGTPVVAFIRNVDVFCLGSYWSGTPWKCDWKCIGCRDSGRRIAQLPFFLTEGVRARNSLTMASSIVTNSEFMQRTLRLVMGLDSMVLHPMVQVPETCEGGNPDGYILFFTPLDYKGAYTAIEIARRMRREKFLFVGESRPPILRQLRGLSNVRYEPWMDDPSVAYRSSRLLIVPSVWPEAYGRVCIEAMGRGIPCVVSGVGALPETIGGGGDSVMPHTDVDAWVEVLEKYSNPSYYAEKSTEACRASRMATKAYDDEVERLIEHLSRLQ